MTISTSTLAKMLVRYVTNRRNAILASIAVLQKVEFDRADVVKMLKNWGWELDLSGEGSHYFKLRHINPLMKRRLVINPQTLTSVQHLNYFLGDAGLKMHADGQIRPDPSVPHLYSLYKQSGFIPGPLEHHELGEVNRTWHPPSAKPGTFKYVKLDDIETDGYPDPKEVFGHIGTFNKNPNAVPPVHLLQLGSENVFGAAEDSHRSVLAAAKKAGMTHVPATIESV